MPITVGDTVAGNCIRWKIITLITKCNIIKISHDQSPHHKIYELRPWQFANLSYMQASATFATTTITTATALLTNTFTKIPTPIPNTFFVIIMLCRSMTMLLCYGWWIILVFPFRLISKHTRECQQCLQTLIV